ncbi:MAG: MotA/TolQ/ExbB proton channel family protein [Hyphomicrobium sp.]
MIFLTAAGAAPDYSFYGMFMQADPVVKSVMVGLLLASVACWAVIFEKLVRLLWLRRQVGRLEKIAQSGTASGSERGLVGKLLASSEDELLDGASRGEDRTAVRARIERAMRGTLKSELQRQEAGLPFLATIGSAAPFIGLFGTVWGIMNSFTAIGQQQDTSLATVAPGIAEALLATALGLAAAIPAVMAYNAVSVALGRLAARAGTSLVAIAKTMSRPTSETVVPMRAGKGI